MLYTDGLVERRDADIDTGVATLERAFAGATGSPEIVCDRLLRSLGITAEHDDDVAVLVLQHPARTGPDAELFHNAALDLSAAPKQRRAPARSPPACSPPGASPRNSTTSACSPPANSSPTPSSTAPRPCGSACGAPTAG